MPLDSIIPNSTENATSADNQQGSQFQKGWIVGFVDGEGCFSISIFKNKTSKFGWQIMPEFVVTQGAKSLDSLKSIKQFFDCGHIFINNRYDNHKEPIYRFCVRKRSDLLNVILPFFKKHPLQTAKQQDSKNFSKVLLMMKNHEHLTRLGLISIISLMGKKIKLTKNQ